jgi:hypothetical protein
MHLGSELTRGFVSHARLREAKRITWVIRGNPQCASGGLCKPGASELDVYGEEELGYVFSHRGRVGATRDWSFDVLIYPARRLTLNPFSI